MRRRDFIKSIAGTALAWPTAANSQGRTGRVGFLGVDTPSALESRVEALRMGLRDLGYLEGKNVEYVTRYANGTYDQLSVLAAELVNSQIDVLVTQGTPATIAAKRTTTTIPIVMTVVGDAVGTGIVESLSRPERNITGITFFVTEFGGKRLEMLQEVKPTITQVALLVNPNNRAMEPILRAMKDAAQSLNVGMIPVEVRGASDIGRIFSSISEKRIDAVVVPDDALFVARVKMIASEAIAKRLPSVGFKEFADAGGLMAYGANRLEMFRRAAYYVDKILKGTQPSDLPVERPTKFETIINLKAAEVLGLKVPPTLLVRADEVIE